MSEKFLQRLAVENSELQNIGCMSGMFQMFDRQRLIAGRRPSGCGSNKNVPPGHTLDSRNLGSDQSTYSPETILAKNLSKSFSTESSKTSFSSSSYSSFYSGDCIKTTQAEIPSVDRCFYVERSTKNPTSSKNFESDAKAAYCKPQIQPANAPIHYERQSHDLRVVVKHSMNKNGHDLPSEQEGSPKSTRFSKFEDASQRTRIKENLQIPVHKIQKAPNYVIEANESPRKTHCLINASYPISEESPRFSLDGRESFSTLNSQANSTPFSKHRECPRLSLDSRVGSLRRFNFDSEPKLTLEKHNQSITSFRRTSVDLIQLQGTSHCKRSSSVVVRLMGLDTMTNLNKEQDAISKSSVDETVAPKLRLLDPATPIFKIPEPVHRCQTVNMMFEKREARMRQQPGYVYREIEERLEELEFQKCNKDLRALKQIIDSMRAKEAYLKNSKGGQPSTKSVCDSPTVNFENPRTVGTIVSLCKGRKTQRIFEPPIVIRKPATRISRSNLSSPSVIPLEYFTSRQRLHMSRPVNENSITIKTVKDISPKYSFREPTQSVHSGMKCRKEQKCLLKTSLRQSQVSASSANSSNCTSPRSKMKKIETEKGSNLAITSEKLLKQKTANRTLEVVSPRTRLSQRSLHANQSKADKLNDISIKTGSLTGRGDDIFLTSGSHISLASQLNWSTKLSLPISHQDSCPSVHSSQTHVAHSCAPNEEVLTPKLPKIVEEQPGPHSVLHAFAYQDASSPLKEFFNEFTDDDTNQISATSAVVDFPSHKQKPIFSNKKLKNIERLVKKLSELTANHDLAPDTDYVPSFRGTQCLDNFYVYEILLASGILMEDLTCDSMGRMPMELHPSGHPINPELFLVLEQTKSPSLRKLISIKNKSQLKSDPEKLHRKLVFDLVNELLTQKIRLSSPELQPQLLHQSIIAKFPSGQQLLKELCAKIKQLKVKSCAASCKDDSIETLDEAKLHLLDRWNSFSAELPEIVKKIERLIFKDVIEDLIDEILPVKNAFALQA